jgi:hypothetical protein
LEMMEGLARESKPGMTDWMVGVVSMPAWTPDCTPL